VCIIRPHYRVSKIEEEIETYMMRLNSMILCSQKLKRKDKRAYSSITEVSLPCNFEAETDCILYVVEHCLHYYNYDDDDSNNTTYRNA
jgi:hypothetical protein